jgi:uncharacterized membrane protein YeaQ/YmgE (transglycosylase-associated protein family)
MLGALVVFALTGVLTGAAARLFYPGRQPVRVLGTMVVGMVGSLLGGLIGWACWPAQEGQLYAGTLLVALLGAVVLLAVSAGVAHARSISGQAGSRPTVP